MMWLLLLTVAAHAGRWDDATSDIVVERVIPASPDRVHAPLLNLQVLEQVFPADCVTDWVHGTPTSGVGAMTRVTYRMGSMKRRLTATISKSEPGRLLELDHDGRKGFVTQFRLEAVPEGSKVTLGTWIEAPPRPFKGIFFKNVRPAWEACYTAALDNLHAMATTSSVPPVQGTTLEDAPGLP